MPALPNSQSDGISIGGHTSSLGVQQFLIGTGIGASAFVLLACLGLVSSSTTPTGVHLARPPAARLRPDVTFPESPFAHRPRPRPSSVAAPPKTCVSAPICEVYRYSGHWLAGPKPSSPKQSVNKSPSPVNCPVPQHQVVPHRQVVHQRQVPHQFADQAVKKQASTSASQVAFSPEQLLALWDSAVHLHQVADDVVGAHPDALPLQDRFTPPAGAHWKISFPWVSSSDVSADADFKFGLVHSIDTAPAPVVKLAPAPEPTPTALFNWGSVSYTLEKPLRGNKLQRAPFVRSHRRNGGVTTNVIFPKGSPFYTPGPSRSASAVEKHKDKDKENVKDKENINVYASPKAVRALV
ncbi:hypothetical protein B0H13DRAFT_2554997 [Mycena leptocephala]|nr:hypothetical protein B0H13DRAFT_2554997 [Mycena leptocephala]